MSNAFVIVALVAKIVFGFLVCEHRKVVDNVIRKLQKKFNFGTITHRPGLLRFFGLNIIQQDDFNINMDGNVKLQEIGARPITRMRHRELESRLNGFELKAVLSINTAIGWLRITASTFRAFFGSSFQERGADATVADLCRQALLLRELKTFRTALLYARSTYNVAYDLFFAILCDASHSPESGHLFYIGGLLTGPLSANGVFHIITWSSQKNETNCQIYRFCGNSRCRDGY